MAASTGGGGGGGHGEESDSSVDADTTSHTRSRSPPVRLGRASSGGNVGRQPQGQPPSSSQQRQPRRSPSPDVSSTVSSYLSLGGGDSVISIPSSSNEGDGSGAGTGAPVAAAAGARQASSRGADRGRVAADGHYHGVCTVCGGTYERLVAHLSRGKCGKTAVGDALLRSLAANKSPGDGGAVGGGGGSGGGGGGGGGRGGGTGGGGYNRGFCAVCGGTFERLGAHLSRSKCGMIGVGAPRSSPKNKTPLGGLCGDFHGVCTVCGGMYERLGAHLLRGKCGKTDVGGAQLGDIAKRKFADGGGGVGSTAGKLAVERVRTTASVSVLRSQPAAAGEAAAGGLAGGGGGNAPKPKMVPCPVCAKWFQSIAIHIMR